STSRNSAAPHSRTSPSRQSIPRTASSASRPDVAASRTGLPREGLLMFARMRPLLSLAVLALVTSASAEAPRVLPSGTQPNDIRLKPLKDLDGYFPFQPPGSPEEWNERAE